jgi:uncharacterized protein (DUF488 family)
MTGQPEILTIGHSTHSIDRFITLLQLHGVTAIADVRSQPFSRYAPQFNRTELTASLRGAGIQYVFLGRELGARSNNPDCYLDGRVQYDRLARTDEFKAGLARILHGALSERLALMCTEKDPLDCHRTVLVARHLTDEMVHVAHIRSDGSLETHGAAMDRLMQQSGMQPSLFRSRDEQIDEALAAQESKIAYVDAELAALSQRAVS